MRDSTRVAGQGVADTADAVFDECARAVGVVHVAGAVVSVEDLTGLGDGGEQGVVAALSFLLLVVSDGGAFGMALGAEHRAVEVERDSREAMVGEALEHEAAVECAQPLDAGRIGGAQSPADGGDRGEVSQAHGAFDHVVVGVVVDIAQVTKAEQQVHDEHEDDEVVGVGGGVGQMAKAPSQLLFEATGGRTGAGRG